MKSAILSITLAALASLAHAAASGSPEGFAKGTTGGGSAAPVYPSTNAQLVSYLTDSSPRNIVLTKTFDFRGSEGSVTETGCAPWGTGSKCQLAINKDNWCVNYQASSPKASVTYDKAGLNPIKVGSNKSIYGQGSSGVIIGKGLRIAGGVKNVIIQNIHITNLNPKYVWGGDAITLDGSDLVWIDHVKTSLIGRQHIVLGNGASNRVTISNSEIDGYSSWSATCDNHHYWAIYITGSNDLVTMKGNYIHSTSGRAPKLGGKSLVHMVNNYFYDNTGHALEVDAGGKVVAEGNVFQNVKAAYQTGLPGQIFTVSDSATANKCSSSLGHTCQANAYGTSGALVGSDASILGLFSGKSVAPATGANTAKNVVKTAGFGKI